jgi:DNA-binding transcriptional ArsR family regulator
VPSGFPPDLRLIRLTATAPATRVLPDQEAATYAEWFASLAEPTRVRLLHTVATTPGGITVGHLTELLGISQSTCSHHVRKLAEVGFLKLHKEGTSTGVMINPACCVSLPHISDASWASSPPPLPPRGRTDRRRRARHDARGLAGGAPHLQRRHRLHPAQKTRFRHHTEPRVVETQPSQMPRTRRDGID